MRAENPVLPNLQKGMFAGFSLVELIVVLTIAAILLTIGVPGFRSLIQRQQMATTVTEFFAAVNLTRSEAIKRGVRVDLMPANGDNDWGKGWVVVVDRNSDQKPNAGDEIIFSHGPVSAGITIEAKLRDKKAHYLAYNGTGRAQAGAFVFKLDGQDKRKITINFLGRPRVCNPATDGDSCKA